MTDIRPDPRRAYWQKPQLTDYEAALLNRIGETPPLQLTFDREVKYLLRGKKVNTRAARRLIDHNYVVPESRGLFKQGPAQTWVLNPKLQRRSAASV